MQNISIHGDYGPRKVSLSSRIRKSRHRNSHFGVQTASVISGPSSRLALTSGCVGVEGGV